MKWYYLKPMAKLHINMFRTDEDMKRDREDKLTKYIFGDKI
jgi:hypothetical protein